MQTHTYAHTHTHTDVTCYSFSNYFVCICIVLVWRTREAQLLCVLSVQMVLSQRMRTLTRRADKPQDQRLFLIYGFAGLSLSTVRMQCQRGLRGIGVRHNGLTHTKTHTHTYFYTCLTYHSLALSLSFSLCPLCPHGDAPSLC